MKPCLRCRQHKPDEDYELRSDTGRHRNVCRVCRNADIVRRRREDPAPDYARKRRYVLKNPQLYRDAVKRYADRNPAAIKARWAAYYAARRGTIARPDQCSQCGGRDKRIEAHHEDYSKPLEVKWLCSKCHGLTRRTA